MAQRHIAIIPARAGSKSIKNKNLIKLPDNRGDTITRLAVKQAIDSKIFKNVILTSDIPKVKIDLDDLSGNAMTQFEYITRPGFLCTDDSLMIDVVKHAMDYLGNAYDYVWLLQPTSPIRYSEDFTNIEKILRDEYYKSVISYRKVTEHPSREYTITEEKLENKTLLKAHPLKFSNFSNKQDLKEIYIRSGNFYVAHKDLIREYSTFENKPIYPYVVSRSQGCNIDSEEDLAMLKYFLNKGTVRV